MGKDHPPQIEKLKCKECGYENEPERVYCHNCGAKLDRTLIVRKQREQKEQAAKQARKPMRSTLARRPVFKPAAFALFLAMLVAAGIQMVRLPDDVPPPLADALEYPQLLMNLSDAQIERRRMVVRLSEQDVNHYFAGSIRAGSTSLLKDYTKFSRAIAQFTQGKCALGFEQLVFGHPLYVFGFYDVEIQGGGLVARSKGGRIGRLPVHPAVMQFADTLLFRQLFGVLKREREVVAAAQRIEFGDQFVDIAIGPPQP